MKTCLPTGPSFRRLIDILDYLVDDRVGIVRYVQDARREAGVPDFFHYFARACSTQALSLQTNFSAAGGAAATRERAIAKAVGEAVERYCGALFSVEDLPLESVESAPFPCVSPDAFALYSVEQYESPGFPWVPFDEQTPVRWAPAVNPLTGKTLYVPAAMVFIPYYYYQGTGDAPIVQPISTGLACHCSPAEAAISAACETIERDAFTITWQGCVSAPHVLVETLSDANYDLVRRFEQTGSEVTILNITTDAGIPSILSVLRHPAPQAPALTFAASTALDPEEAIRKSLEELAHTRRYMQQIKNRMPPLVPDLYHANVVDQITHLHFWNDHAQASLADFVFASPRRVEFDEIENLATGNPAEELAILCERIEAVGHRVLITDVTTPDVGELGLSVVRAVIPGFHPLFMGYGIRALGGSRLWEVPQKLGHPGVKRASGDNPVPHPYP
ncbi:MAG: hypothetical protein FJ147_12105 [Deltaproteobacteria bacterium]|nr:hypothetical protein [Deltaproteobacteria bacterium]